MPIRAIFKKLEKSIRFIENALLIVCGAIFMLLMFLGTADILGRFLFNKPVVATYEISTVMMGAIVLLGWAYTQKEEGHVRVDLFYNMFPFRMQTISSIVTLFLSLALFAVIAQQSWDIAMKGTLEGRTFVVIDFPVGPFYFLVPVGAFLICLEFIVRIFYLIPSLRKA
jgi:TRAP-type C4-dicarboxylate transport system permease small subunit